VLEDGPPLRQWVGIPSLDVAHNVHPSKTNQAQKMLVAHVAVLAGCDQNLVTAEGTVTCDGVPLAYTTVKFVPDAGTPGNGAVAETDEAGRYSLSSINPDNSTSGLGEGIC